MQRRRMQNFETRDLVQFTSAKEIVSQYELAMLSSLSVWKRLVFVNKTVQEQLTRLYWFNLFVLSETLRTIREADW